ncbi:MAG: glycosyltransferase family 4 protein, partial [Candidatus Omnitrophota bacterium]
MKIFYICYENIGGYNGAIRHIIEIVLHLQKLGHQVQLCAPGIGKYIEKPPINVKYIPVINLPLLRPLTYIFLAPVFLIIYLFRFKPDVIYTREIFFSFCQEALILKLLSYPAVIEVNGMATEQQGLPSIFSLFRPIIKLIQKINFNFFDKIIVHTEGLKQKIEKEYKIQSSKLAIISMGVDTGSFKPIPKEEARKKLNLELDYYYIGFVGSLSFLQGINILIESSPFIVKEIPKARFLIVGGGRLKDRLMRHVKEIGLEGNFIFTGEVPFNAVVQHISALDVGVVFFEPIREDPGDPIKLYEYLACGIPVVASNIIGYGDVVERMGTGKAVDSSDPRLVSNVIVDLLRDKDTREKMANRGGPDSVKDYSWLRRAEQVEGCLSDIRDLRMGKLSRKQGFYNNSIKHANGLLVEKNLKILCICYEDIAGYAGSNRQVIELVKGLEEIGHQVKLTVPLIRRLNEPVGLDIEYIPVINLPVIRYFTYLVFSPFYLIKIFLKFKPNTVFVFQIYWDIGSLFVCKLFRCPVAFYINNIAFEDFALTKTPKYIIYIAELIQKVYVVFANKIFVITDVIKEYINLKYNIPLERIEIVKDAVNIEDFKPMDKDEARVILGLERGNNLVGFLGSLYPWHGVDYLIDSAPLVLKEIPNTKFIIAGSGPMAKA